MGYPQILYMCIIYCMIYDNLSLKELQKLAPINTPKPILNKKQELVQLLECHKISNDKLNALTMTQLEKLIPQKDLPPTIASKKQLVNLVKKYKGTHTTKTTAQPLKIRPLKIPRTSCTKIPRNVHVASKQGKRPTMEDTHAIHICNGIKYYAVYDGHGGKSVSRQLRDAFHKVVFAHINSLATKSEANVKTAIRDAFLEMDRRLYNNFLKSKDPSGSTANVVIQIKDKLYIANLGDTRAVIFNSRGNVIYHSEDHRPALASERTRIKTMGGKIVDNRVNGILAVSRAFGNFEPGLGLKTLGNKYLGEMAPVSPDPVIKVVDLKKVRDRKLYCIIACDGLWDFFPQAQVISTIFKLARQFKQDGRTNIQKSVVDELVNMTLRERKSTDNVSVMLFEIHHANDTVGKPLMDIGGIAPKKAVRGRSKLKRKSIRKMRKSVRKPRKSVRKVRKSRAAKSKGRR